MKRKFIYDVEKFVFDNVMSLWSLFAILKSKYRPKYTNKRFVDFHWIDQFFVIIIIININITKYEWASNQSFKRNFIHIRSLNLSPKLFLNLGFACSSFTFTIQKANASSYPLLEREKIASFEGFKFHYST